MKILFLSALPESKRVYILKPNGACMPLPPQQTSQNFFSMFAGLALSSYFVFLVTFASGVPLSTKSNYGVVRHTGSLDRLVFQCASSSQSSDLTKSESRVVFTGCSNPIQTRIGESAPAPKPVDSAPGGPPPSTDDSGLVVAAPEPCSVRREVFLLDDLAHISMSREATAAEKGIQDIAHRATPGSMRFRSQSSMARNFVLGEWIVNTKNSNCVKPSNHHDYCRCVRVFCPPKHYRCLCELECRDFSGFF